PCSVDKKNKTLGPVVVRSENDGGPEQLRKTATTSKPQALNSYDPIV
ncbi:hypothetical protein K3495_g7018, partial [Podosphaera aphanis]